MSTEEKNKIRRYAELEYTAYNDLDADDSILDEIADLEQWAYDNDLVGIMREVMLQYMKRNDALLKYRKRQNESSMSLYMNTAGEIEARDVESRLDYTAEERKAKRPDVNRYGVVFSGKDVKHSLDVIVGKSGKDYGLGVILDSNIFDGLNVSQRLKALESYVYENLAGSQVVVYDEKNNVGIVEFAKYGEKIKKQGSKNRYRAIDKLKRKFDLPEQLAVIHSVELLSATQKAEIPYSSANKHGWFDRNGWNYEKVYIQVASTGDIYSAILNIANAEDGRKILYDINKLEKVDSGIKLPQEDVAIPTKSTSNATIPQPGEEVKDKKSSFDVQVDSDGNNLSPQQQTFFKDSKIRDEDGNLLVVYHGTSEDFTVFDRTKARANMDIQGMFFSPWELDSKGYGTKVKAYYLNITNPASEQEGYRALRRFQGQNNAGVKAREYLESLGYDGVNNENEEYVAFYPEQIKLITNTEPTSNEDVRYSIDVPVDNTSDLVRENKKLQQSLEYYKMMSKRNTGHKVRRNAVRSLAMQIKKSWGITLATDDVTSLLTDFFDYISSGDATWEGIEQRGKAFAKTLVDSRSNVGEMSAEDRAAAGKPTAVFFSPYR